MSGRPWTDDELYRVVCDYANGVPLEEMSASFDRSITAIKIQCCKAMVKREVRVPRKTDQRRPPQVIVAFKGSKVWSARDFGECAYPVSGRGASTMVCADPCAGTYCKKHKAIMRADWWRTSGKAPPGHSLSPQATSKAVGFVWTTEQRLAVAR